MHFYRDENRQPILHDYVCQLILTAAEGLPHISSAVESENHPNIATSSTLIRSNVDDQTQFPHLVTQDDSISNSGIQDQDQSNETTSPTMVLIQFLIVISFAAECGLNNQLVH